jgi:hypothetical protein
LFGCNTIENGEKFANEFHREICVILKTFFSLRQPWRITINGCETAFILLSAKQLEISFKRRKK